MKQPAREWQDVEDWSKEHLRAAYAQKKDRVIRAVGGVHKTGTGPKSQGGYSYAEDSEILKTVRSALSESGLNIGVVMVGFVGEPIARPVGQYKHIYYVYNIEFIFEITDLETGYTVAHNWIGQGDDPSDKAISKATTNALKYFLLKNFLLPTFDDAEQCTLPQEQAPADRQGKANTPYPAPGEAFKKPERGEQGSEAAGQQPPADPSCPEDPPVNEGLKLPEYTDPNSKDIMNALADFYQQQDTTISKFNNQTFMERVWQEFQKWPTNAHGAKKIRTKIFPMDVADAI